MRTFQFPLRQALKWRRTQLEVEEQKLQQLAASLAQMELAAARLDLAKGRAEVEVRQSAVVEAGDLWALAAYRQRLLAELQALALRRAECRQQTAAQREKMREAQRQCRLLEKLEQARRAEWQREADKETETLAAESFLARWNRRAD